MKIVFFMLIYGGIAFILVYIMCVFNIGIGTNRRPSALNCKKWKLVLGKHMDVFDTSEKDFYVIYYIPKNGLRWHEFNERSASGGSFTPLFKTKEAAFKRIKNNQYFYARFKEHNYVE